MSPVAICTDSSALSNRVEDDLLVAPVRIVLDGEEASDVDADELYGRLAAGATATTSQPSPGAFLSLYEQAASAGALEVVSIHLDARASGTVSSALLGASGAPIRVLVVDSRTVGFGVGICVRAALELRAAGATAAEIEEAVRRLGESVGNVFVARAAPEGRVGRSDEWAVLSFAGGAAEPRGLAGTEREAIATMAEIVTAAGPGIRAAIGHAAPSLRAAAGSLTSALASDPRVESVERYRVAPAVGAHTGPWSFGAFWWPSR